MGNYNLFLDDFRSPEDAFYYMRNSDYLKLEWVIVRSYNEFVSYIEKNGMPATISFDHDLADIHYEQQTNINYDNADDDEKTGYHCAKWLIDYTMDNDVELPAYMLIHSMNTVGSRNIKSLFENYKHFVKKGAS